MPKLTNVTATTTTRRVVKTTFPFANICTKADYIAQCKQINAMQPGDINLNYNKRMRPEPFNPFFPVAVPFDNMRENDFVPVDIAFPMLQLTYQPEAETDHLNALSGELKFDANPIIERVFGVTTTPTVEQHNVTIANEPSVVSPATLATIVLGIGNTLPPQANKPAATSDVADLTDKRLARLAAKSAVREFYDHENASFPFKAAVDLRYRAAINFARFPAGSVSGTHRTAAALAAIIAYCDVNPDGTFVRGSGRVPRRLLGLTERPDEMLNAGPESGVLSRLIGVGAVAYVSGPTHGIGAETATFRIVKNVARKNMLAHNEKQPNGEHRFSRVLALLG